RAGFAQCVRSPNATGNALQQFAVATQMETSGKLNTDKMETPRRYWGVIGAAALADSAFKRGGPAYPMSVGDIRATAFEPLIRAALRNCSITTSAWSFVLSASGSGHLMC